METKTTDFPRNLARLSDAELLQHVTAGRRRFARASYELTCLIAELDRRRSWKGPRRNNFTDWPW